ncbi:hypothetical protein ABT187_43285 [Streptomyces sp. NPDC001817]|uniref:hypothetical protein n=1 Tax=Streptomyces sp. NPDC001817 TaxID=3154398 RepID=UPI0033275482
MGLEEGAAHAAAVDLDVADGLETAHRPPHGGTLGIAAIVIWLRDIVQEPSETA